MQSDAILTIQRIQVAAVFPIRRTMRQVFRARTALRSMRMAISGLEMVLLGSEECGKSLPVVARAAQLRVWAASRRFESRRWRTISIRQWLCLAQRRLTSPMSAATGVRYQVERLIRS